LYQWAAGTLLASMAFEIIGINGGTYTYWGPHVLRIFEYPLAIGVLEMAQVMCFSIAAAELHRRSTHPLAPLALFAIFPCTFYLANFGAGSPLIIALHVDQPSTLLVAIGTIISIGFALLLVHFASKLLPAANTHAAPAARRLTAGVKGAAS